MNGEPSTASVTEKDHAFKTASTAIDFHELTAQLKQQKKQVVPPMVSKGHLNQMKTQKQITDNLRVNRW